MRIFLGAFLWIVILLNACFAQSGQAAFDSLKIGAGSRALGMAGAFVAVADDASAIYWNPAGMGRIQTDHEILASHTELFFSGGGKNLIFYVQRIGEGKYLGVGIDHVNFGEFDKRPTKDAEYLMVEGISDTVFNFAFSQRFDIFNIGVCLKILRTSLYDVGGSGLGADFGLLLKPIPLFSLGFTLKNLGRVSIKTKESLPLQAKVGACIYPLEDLLISFDLEKYMKEDISFQGGCEFVLKDFLCVRAGYKYQKKVKGPFCGLALGIGLKIKEKDAEGGGRLDYALFSHGDLGLSHYASLGYSF